ncbi:MAG: T9SS type A sorting domain-containing protein, partial [Bacteroidetes bacterium]|nr:T9SS type A sorting domain-containing protein [Bacteroidota bacterium]
DGQSGGWAKGSGCAPVTVTFTIDITNAYITCSCGEPSPDVILGSTPPTICAGNDFDLATLSYVDNSGLGATPVSYYATLPANSGNQISSVVNPETTTTYYVLLQESAAGCADIIEVTIPVTEPIAISAPTTACFNEPIILSSTNGIANWYDADPNAGGLIVHTGVSYSPTPTATGTYQYWATLEGGLCNIAATAVSVDVYGDPPIVSDVAYCFNETATPLTAIGNNNTTLLWWEESVEGTGSFIAPTPNTQIEGLFTYYVSQVENACVSEPAEINVIVNPYQAEIPYNGFDDDCNPLTLDDDLDQDGFTLADDCDDNNANINPNAVEIPDNMVDEDCNGEDLVLAIHEINELKVKVFPNPVSSTLEIIVPENVNYKIELFDVQGKLVQIYRNNNNIISVDNLPEGIYLLKLEELITKETVLKKVVVSK